MKYRFALCGAFAVALLSTGCQKTDSKPPRQTYPSLAFQAEQKQLILSRVGREPYKTALENVRKHAALEWSEPTPVWDVGIWSHNARVAQTNAMLAWLFDDEKAARKAKQFVLDLDTDWETNENFDINISMPRVLVPYTDAIDLLRATKWISAAEVADASERVYSVADKFFQRYVVEKPYRETLLIPAQNNHPIRTATGIGYVGLAFPQFEHSTEMYNWAVNEVAYLLGPNGQYIQPDGGVSEGPFYFQFGATAVLPFLIALDNKARTGSTLPQVCFTRNDRDPWTNHGCKEGEPFTFENPLRSPYFHNAFTWETAMRMPNGLRAFLSDAKVAPLMGAPLLTSYGAPGFFTWDWQINPERPMEMEQFFYLAPHFLAYLDDSVAAEPPTWTTRYFTDTGHAAFRSGWEADDLWLLLVADGGPARKTLHNHGDGSSFSMFSYGEYLLLDPGYYKPNSLNNAETAEFPSHNVVLIDGGGPPVRGLLDDFGDTDAFLENTADSSSIDYAEARISYQGSELRRGIAFVRNRYFVVADRFTGATSSHEYTWRAHLGAGFDMGGLYSISANKVNVLQDLGGMELAITSTAGIPTIIEPPYVKLDPPHVHQFIEQEEFAGDHGVADAVLTAMNPSFLAVIAPFKVGAVGTDDASLTVTSIAAPVATAAWLVEGAAGREVIWLRGSGTSTTLNVPGGTTIESDAALAIASLTGDFALAADGSYVRRNGASLVDGGNQPVKVTP